MTALLGSTNQALTSAPAVLHACGVHRWDSYRPHWWKTVFDQFDLVLDCHNVGGGPNDDESLGINWGPHPSQERVHEAPFTEMNRFKNGSRAVLVFLQCDICQILAGWQSQSQDVDTKFVLVGDMDQDSGVLGVASAIQYIHSCHVIDSAQYNATQQPHRPNVHNPAQVLRNLLEDSRLVLWVVAQHTYAHAQARKCARFGSVSQPTSPQVYSASKDSFSASGNLAPTTPEAFCAQLH